MTGRHSAVPVRPPLRSASKKRVESRVQSPESRVHAGAGDRADRASARGDGAVPRRGSGPARQRQRAAPARPAPRRPRRASRVPRTTRGHGAHLRQPKSRARGPRRLPHFLCLSSKVSTSLLTSRVGGGGWVRVRGGGGLLFVHIRHDEFRRCHIDRGLNTSRRLLLWPSRFCSGARNEK